MAVDEIDGVVWSKISLRDYIWGTKIFFSALKAITVKLMPQTQLTNFATTTHVNRQVHQPPTHRKQSDDEGKNEIT